MSASDPASAAVSPSSASSSSSSPSSAVPPSVPSPRPKTPLTLAVPAAAAAAAAPAAPTTVRRWVDEDKVIVYFRATGDAPILKKNKFKISSSQRFAAVHEFLRKLLKSKPDDSLFLFCTNAFAPSLDAVVGDICACFGVEGKDLVINYCTTDAWG